MSLRHIQSIVYTIVQSKIDNCLLFIATSRVCILYESMPYNVIIRYTIYTIQSALYNLQSTTFPTP